MVTESGTSPFARKLMTFDEVPPGQQPTRITPAAISGGSESALQRIQAVTGMITNCPMTPIRTSSGRLNTSEKSPGFRVRPMPNMTTPRRIGMYPANGVKSDGKKNERAASMRTHTAKVLPTNELNAARVSKNFIMPR